MSAIRDRAAERAHELRRESYQLVIAAFDTAEANEAQRRRAHAHDIEIYPEPHSGTCQFVDPDNPGAWIEVGEKVHVGVRQ